MFPLNCDNQVTALIAEPPHGLCQCFFLNEKVPVPVSNTNTETTYPKLIFTEFVCSVKKVPVCRTGMYRHKKALAFVIGCHPAQLDCEQTASWLQVSLSDAVVPSDYLPVIRLYQYSVVVSCAVQEVCQ